MISIAMATYNGAKWIQEQVESILSQTIQDFELIICDDCSTDGTWEVLNAIKQTDPRIYIHRNEVTLGFKKNFENAISLCNGELIALSDQDDIWFPKHLEILKNAMVGDSQIVCARPVFVNEFNQVLPRKYDYFRMSCPPKTNLDTARHILLGGSNYQGASMLIRRTFFEYAFPIPDRVKFHDNWFALLACFTGGLVYVDEPIMRYRRLMNSVTFNRRRISAFRRFVGITLNEHSAYDGLCFIETIRGRLKQLPLVQHKLLIKSEQILRRRKTLWGRIVNVPYMLRHFQSIYACKIWNMFV